MTDLGIAAGSAVKTAQIHNVDNRLMFTGGVAALDLGFLGGGCTVAFAIPLSATGKNIFDGNQRNKIPVFTSLMFRVSRIIRLIHGETEDTDL